MELKVHLIFFRTICLCFEAFGIFVEEKAPIGILAFSDLKFKCAVRMMNIGKFITLIA